MSNQGNPRQEQASTYFVQDRSYQDEMARLRLQDQLVTTGMGGTLAEQANPTSLQHVLDIGCGTGGWLIEVAQTYPGIVQLVGVDINPRMIKYAQAQAAAQGIADRVQFQTMDVMRKVDFPDASFDLVNERFGSSYLRTWDWPNFLMECQRVTRPGGVVRLTESENNTSNSQAMAQLYQLLRQGFHQSGHLFNADTTGVAGELARMLNQYGLLNVQTRPHMLDYRVGTPQGDLLYEDGQRVFRSIVPFLQKWTIVPDDYDAIYKQAFSDLQQPDSVAEWHLLTAWGTKRGA